MATQNDLPPTIYRSPLVRLSYPIFSQGQLDAAKERWRRAADPDSREPTPGATLIFDKVSQADPTYADRMVVLANAIYTVAKGRWATEAAAVEMPWLDNGAFHSPWLDGNLPKYRDKDGLGAGTRFIRASSKLLIPVVGRDSLPILDVSKVYPGCYVYALLAVFGYSNNRSHGVSFGLRGIQFVRDGDRLDDSVDVSSAFGPLEGDESPRGEGLEALKNLFGGAAA